MFVFNTHSDILRSNLSQMFIIRCIDKMKTLKSNGRTATTIFKLNKQHSFVIRFCFVQIYIKQFPFYLSQP